MRKKIVMVVLASATLFAQTQNQAKFPPMQEGYWSVHTETVDNPGAKKSEGTRMVCRNHAYDAYVQGKALNVPGCKPMSVTVSGNKYSTELECTVSGTVIKTKGTAVVNDSMARAESRTTYTPAFNGVTDSTMTTEQKFLERVRRECSRETL